MQPELIKHANIHLLWKINMKLSNSPVIHDTTKPSTHTHTTNEKENDQLVYEKMHWLQRGEERSEFRNLCCALFEEKIIFENRCLKNGCKRNRREKS